MRRWPYVVGGFALVAACGVAQGLEPPLALREAAERVSEADVVTAEVSLALSSVPQLDGAAVEAVWTREGASRVAVLLDGTTAAELVTAGTQACVRVELDRLTAWFDPAADIETVRADAVEELGKLGIPADEADALTSGSWGCAPLDALTELAGTSGFPGLEGEGAAPFDLAAMSDLIDGLVDPWSVTDGNDDGPGRHLVAEADAAELVAAARDLIVEVLSGGLGPSPLPEGFFDPGLLVDELLGDLSPSGTVVVDFWVGDDDALSRIQADLADAAAAVVGDPAMAAEPIVLTVDLATEGSTPEVPAESFDLTPALEAIADQMGV